VLVKQLRSFAAFVFEYRRYFVVHVLLVNYVTQINVFLFGLDVGGFTVDQAVDKLGFGKFQIKLSLLTGLAWVHIRSLLEYRPSCRWLMRWR
jgi:hypothetical protein